MRKVSTIILYDENLNLLFQHRDSQAPTIPNQWAHFGGGMKEKETPLQCVKRECFEELEYELKNPEFVEKISYPDQIFYLYVEKYDGSPFQVHEGDKAGWFSIDEIKNLNLHYKIDYISKKAIEYLVNKNS